MVAIGRLIGPQAFILVSMMAVYFSAAAGFFICFRPGRHPSRRLVWWVCLPAVFGNVVFCSTYFVNSSYSGLSTLGPGFHYALIGITLVALFTFRVAVGFGSLPLALPESSVLGEHELVSWPRVEIFLWLLLAAVPAVHSMFPFMNVIYVLVYSYSHAGAFKQILALSPRQTGERGGDRGGRQAGRAQARPVEPLAAAVVRAEHALVPADQNRDRDLRLYLQEVAPNFRLYVSPINIDPTMPISEPASFITDVSKKLGPFLHHRLPRGSQGPIERRIHRRGISQTSDHRAGRTVRPLRVCDPELRRRAAVLLLLQQRSAVAHVLVERRRAASDRQPEEAAKFFGHIKRLYQKLDEVIGDLHDRYGGRRRSS